MKGITPIIAIVLLLMITIALVGFAFVFFSRTLSGSANATEAQLQQQMRSMTGSVTIENVNGDKVYIRNSGNTDINSAGLAIYANGVKLVHNLPVVLKPGEECSQDEIIDWCTARLKRFKSPKQVRFVNALPKNLIGKVLRRELRSME